MENIVARIMTNPEFQKLAKIGGHKVYHLEGNAFIHTQMVIAEAQREFPGDNLMLKVAALHDIGKIYTSICHGENDWEYPDHSTCGAFRGILSKFIPESDPDFKAIQWYIRNHIKPLYWMEKGTPSWEKFMENAPDIRCSPVKLARFAICDIRGSKSTVDQSELVDFLYHIR